MCKLPLYWFGDIMVGIMFFGMEGIIKLKENL